MYLLRMTDINNSKIIRLTCTPLVDVGEFIIEAIALSNAACVERLGVLREIPCTLFVRLWVLAEIDCDG